MNLHDSMTEGIYNVALNFRNAIVTAKRQHLFSQRDRMSNFPFGCCDDSCDLLAYLLLNEYGIETVQMNGVYDDGEFSNLTNHAWLDYKGTIIDITIDQFIGSIAFGVYVGPELEFYRDLKDVKVVGTYDITKDKRLYSDYKKIMNLH